MDERIIQDLEKYFGSKLEALADLMGVRFDGMDDKLNRIDKNQESIEEIVDDMKKVLDNSIQKLDKRISEVEGRVKILWGWAVFILTTVIGAGLVGYVSGWFS